MRLMTIAVASSLLLAAFGALPSPARADDAQVGYYYPKPQTVEHYRARVATLPESDRNRRLAFVTGLSKANDTRPYAPTYIVFAKGDDSDKLIIVGTMDGELNTLYRSRALLASLTAAARLTEFFQKNSIAEYATFLDFMKLLGFKEVTVTNGVAFAHQIKIE
jgi:hypothetical protein